LLKVANSNVWANKKNIAIFRGALRKEAQYNNTHPVRIGKISGNNWYNIGRGKLLVLKINDEYLKSKLDIAFSNTKNMFKEWNITSNYSLYQNEPLQMDLLDQDKYFKYIIYAEGNCGWSDRLKKLLFLGMVIIIQETLCNEYYKEFMVPMVHYVPVDYYFNNLSLAIQWLENNDDKAYNIVKAAQALAKELLSLHTIKYYFTTLLRKYTSYLSYNVQLQPTSVLFIKSNYTCDKLMCNDDFSFNSTATFTLH